MKIIIIGSGLIGVSTAYFLSQQGHAVQVLDRKDGAGMDTSFANGGMLTPSQAEPWNQPGIFWKALAWLGNENSPFLVRPRAVFSILGWGLGFIRNSTRQRYYANMHKNARLASYSIQMVRELRQKHDLHYDENTRGTLKIFTEQKNFQEAVKHSRFYKELDIAFRILDAKEVIELEPSLSALRSTIVGGVHYPGDESGDAHKFCRSLAAQAEQSGVNFNFQVEVSGFEYEHNKITAVKTSSGNYSADVYVLAAGSYSTLLAGSLNISLPVRPVKGYSLTLDINGWDNGPKLPVVNESLHIAMTPLGSRLRVAGTAEINGYDVNIRQSRVNHMIRYVTQVYPGLAGTLGQDAVTTWTGLRPYSSDGVPILGKTPFNNLYLNTGHGHLGWSMAAGSGRLVSDIICGNVPFLDPEPYRLGRQAVKKSF